MKHRRPAVFALQTCTVHIISRHKHASLRMYESAILSVCRKSCVGLFRYAISAKKTSHLGRAPETFDELVEQIRFGHGEHVLFLWCAARIQNHQSVNGGIREPVNTLGMRYGYNRWMWMTGSYGTAWETSMPSHADPRHQKRSVPNEALDCPEGQTGISREHW